MKRSVWQKLQDHPIIAAWFGVWFVVAALNFHAGAKTGGYPLAIAFVCVAMLGAYASKELDGVTGARRTGLSILVVLQLLLGQWAGWSTLGLNLNSNAAGLDTDAGTHNTAAEQLAQAKAERAKLGTPRTIAAIEADEHLECESGVGPKCTALRRELADAQRASDLDRDIPELVKQLGQGPQLTDPNAPYRVAQAFGSTIASWINGAPRQASRDDVIFWFSIFVTAVLEFVGTCGPWLFRLSEKWSDPEPPKPAVDTWDFGPKQIAYQPHTQGGVSAPSAPHAETSATGSDRHGDFHSVVASGQNSPRGSGSSSAGGDGLHQPLQTSASVPTNQHQHGAPITFNLSLGDTPSASRPPRLEPTPLVPINHDAVADKNVAALRDVGQRALPQIEPSVREAPDRPVDNEELMNMLHGLTGFKAACLVDQKGAWIEAATVYQRYLAWAQERACNEAAFHSLFPAATKVELKLAGGVPHYAGIALKRLAIAKEAS
jgi:hypothetical protein